MDDLRLFKIPNRETDVAPEEDVVLKKYYESWRRTNKEGFAMIYNDFRDKHLADLKGGPLKLYLFFAFAADNDEGDSFYSVARIAEMLKTSPRSIDSWIKDLVDRQLIARGKTGKRVNNTYLLPYSTSLVELPTPKNINANEWQNISDFYLARIRNYSVIYGDVIGVYHLYQWDGANNKTANQSNHQLLLFITKRKGDVLTGHYYKLRDSKEMIVDKTTIDKMVRFASHLNYESKPMIGIGISHTKKLTEISNKALKVLTEQLAQLNGEDDDLFDHVSYGRAEIFEADEEYADETEIEE